MPQTSQTHSHSRGGDGHDSATEELKHKAAEVVQDVRELGGQVGQVAREQYEDLRGVASDYIKRGREKAKNWEGGVEKYIQDKPLRAILLAAGAGVILGLLWRRR